MLAIAERKGEGSIASNGAFAAFTGAHTGRSPKDKFIVVDDETRARVAWGEINQAMQLDVFDRLAERFLAYLRDKQVFVEDVRAGADSTYQLRVRLISEFAWHALFAKQLFISPENDFHSLSPDFAALAHLSKPIPLMAPRILWVQCKHFSLLRQIGISRLLRARSRRGCSRPNANFHGCVLREYDFASPRNEMRID